MTFFGLRMTRLTNETSVYEIDNASVRLAKKYESIKWKAIEMWAALVTIWKMAEGGHFVTLDWAKKKSNLIEAGGCGAAEEEEEEEEGGCPIRWRWWPERDVTAFVSNITKKANCSKSASLMIEKKRLEEKKSDGQPIGIWIIATIDNWTVDGKWIISLICCRGGGRTWPPLVNQRWSVSSGHLPQSFMSTLYTMHNQKWLNQQQDLIFLFQLFEEMDGETETSFCLLLKLHWREAKKTFWPPATIYSSCFGRRFTRSFIGSTC